MSRSGEKWIHVFVCLLDWFRARNTISVAFDVSDRLRGINRTITFSISDNNGARRSACQPKSKHIKSIDINTNKHVNRDRGMGSLRHNDP